MNLIVKNNLEYIFLILFVGLIVFISYVSNRAINKKEKLKLVTCVDREFLEICYEELNFMHILNYHDHLFLQQCLEGRKVTR